FFFFFSSRRRHTRSDRDWSSDVCSSDLATEKRMTNNSQIWVSELNARTEIRSAFPQSTVHFYDTTLRDGEQTVGVILSPQQKLEDRKSTRLNSSHDQISYAVFCLKKKKK